MDKIDEDLKPIDDSYIIELFQHDGDTTNPRDYYTKIEADEKFATKDEVENIDLSNLATKEEANNALNKANEAFQRGDNVKNQLVDKLISEGLNVSTNNTFEELIGNIALGKKWASGEGNSYNANNKAFFKVSNLSFEPSVILVFPVENYQIFHAYWDNDTINSKSVFVSAGTGVIFSSALTTITNDGFDVPLYSTTQSVRKMKWIAFE